jgi:hypothetical protein
MLNKTRILCAAVACGMMILVAFGGTAPAGASSSVTVVSQWQATARVSTATTTCSVYAYDITYPIHALQRSFSISAPSPSVYGYAGGSTLVTSQTQLVDVNTGKIVVSSQFAPWTSATSTAPATWGATTFTGMNIADHYVIHYNVWWAVKGVLTGNVVLQTNTYNDVGIYEGLSSSGAYTQCFSII